MRFWAAMIVAGGGVFALAAWPTVISHRPLAPAASATPAPVLRDYLQRDAVVAFEERQVREHPGDQITARMLAGNYMERFREQGDIGDIARAQAQAERSIRLQPQGNTQAQAVLASALLTYHRFREALVHERDAIAGEPTNVGARAQEASLLMELGKYGEAGKILAKTPPGPENPTWDSIIGRYDELTGRLVQARAIVQRAANIVDANYSTPAYTRSWYHMRLAQLAWESGDDTTAQREFDRSLQLFPDNSMALMWEARYFRSLKQWRRTLAAATRSANLYPLPQALGYEADAQRALGMVRNARETDALIRAEQRLFNVQGINDRLLANYYADRRIHLSDALRYAKIDRRQRGNEIYSDDTMAWVLAALGRWKEARTYMVQATRFNTQDAELEYHAAIVALRTAHRSEGIQRLKMALALNPHFHPVYADEARTILARLGAS